MLKYDDMLKYLALPVLGVALCVSSVVSAQTSKHKRVRAQAPAQVQVPTPAPPEAQCAIGAGKNSDGTCVTQGEWAAIRSGVNQANALSQFRMNWNWSAAYGPSGDYSGLSAKNTQVFDQGLNGIAKPAAAKASDFRFKRDVTPLALLDDGVMLYSFRYFWSDQVYVGVMAQQAAAINPGAVVMQSNGYLWVNYDRLGLKMQTWQEWQASRATKASIIVAAP